METETLKRARWYPNGPTTRVLKLALKDGGDVLATVENVGFMRTRCPWKAAGLSGVGWTAREAMACARAALEALHGN